MKNDLSRLKHELDPYLSKKSVFGEADKQRIRKKIDDPKPKKKMFLIPRILTAALFAAAFVVILGFVGKQMGLLDFPKSGAEPVAIEKLQGNPVLEAFPFTVKLPSYAPFQVNKVEVKSIYTGPMDEPKSKMSDLPQQSKLHPKKKASANLKKRMKRLKKEHPKLVRPTIWYLSENPKTGAGMALNIIWRLPLKKDTGGQVVQLINGKKALYLSRGGSRLSWKEGELTYQLVLAGKKFSRHPAVAKKELLKIANSFVPYKK